MEQCGFLQGALGSSLASSFLKSCKFSFQPIKHGLFSSLSLKVITIPFLLFSKTNKQRHFSKKGQSTNSLVETLNIYIYIHSIWDHEYLLTCEHLKTRLCVPNIFVQYWNAATYVHVSSLMRQFHLRISNSQIRNAISVVHRRNIVKTSCVF